MFAPIVSTVVFPGMSAQIAVSSMLAIAAGGSMFNLPCSAQYRTKSNTLLQTSGGKCCPTVVLMRNSTCGKKVIKSGGLKRIKGRWRGRGLLAVLLMYKIPARE